MIEKSLSGSWHAMKKDKTVKPILSACLTMFLTLVGTGMAQDTTPLSAAQSNHETLGWVQGFPPAANKTIRFTDPDYFVFPKLRWTVCHFRELLSSVAVRNGNEDVSDLSVDLDAGLNAVEFTPLGGR